MGLLLFPSEPFYSRSVDPDFAHELEAARAAGFDTALVDHTAVTMGDLRGAVASVPSNRSDVLYRGWMLTAPQYKALHKTLHDRGVHLVTHPENYEFCHHLPKAYSVIKGHTPRSVWLPVSHPPDFEAIARTAAQLGDVPAVLKDYVKSQKHYWTQACYIPKATDREAVQSVVERFLELQADQLNEGLVFREFVPLKVVGEHPKSQMPLAAEVRTFWAKGKLLFSHNYWADLAEVEAPPQDLFKNVAADVPSQFFSMDVALRQDGTWTIVELGDGQVTGLPDPKLALPFYQALKTCCG